LITGIGNVEYSTQEPNGYRLDWTQTYVEANAELAEPKENSFDKLYLRLK